jgi:hypothetical protein
MRSILIKDILLRNTIRYIDTCHQHVLHKERVSLLVIAIFFMKNPPPDFLFDIYTTVGLCTAAFDLTESEYRNGAVKILL